VCLKNSKVIGAKQSRRVCSFVPNTDMYETGIVGINLILRLVCTTIVAVESGKYYVL
jgi:hypothetical protein